MASQSKSFLLRDLTKPILTKILAWTTCYNCRTWTCTKILGGPKKRPEPLHALCSGVIIIIKRMPRAGA